MVRWNAVVLAGGRSSRLSGTPKAGLTYRGESLLQRAVACVSGADVVVVVGVVPDGVELPGRVRVVRESPPFAGPAAAIGAGLGILAGPDDREFTLVLACDMPEADVAVRTLLDAPADAPGGDQPVTDGFIAVDATFIRQPLAALYRTDALRRAADDLAGQRAGGRATGLAGKSVRALLRGLRLTDVPVVPGSTDDVDTWDDAARFGIRWPDRQPTPGQHIPATTSKGESDGLR